MRRCPKASVGADEGLRAGPGNCGAVLLSKETQNLSALEGWEDTGTPAWASCPRGHAGPGGAAAGGARAATANIILQLAT